MKKCCLNYSVVLAILLSFNKLPAQNTARQINSLFNAVNRSERVSFNGSMVVADKGKIVFQVSKGYADIDKKILNSNSTNFSLASLSKVFTAVAVMQLKERGEINLDEALVKYLPGLPFENITIKQVLSHTAGLPDFEIFRGYTPAKAGKQLSLDDLIPALAKSKLIAEPGTSWHYSNIGFGLLALLVEKISNMSFQQYIRQNICVPAGLANTYVDIPGNNIPDAQKATQYVRPMTAPALSAADSLRTDNTDAIQTMPGPGLIRSSIKDLLKFDAALNNGTLLKKETQQEMYTPATLNNGGFAALEHALLYNGLGWGIDIDSSAGKIVSHTGGSPGISTIFLSNISNNQLVIVLENTDNRLPLPIAINAMRLLNGKPLAHFRTD